MGPSHENPSPRQPGALISEFSNDADMAELIEYFLGELNDRIGQLERAWHDDDRAQLCVMAHQLKGAAAGYGFPTITDRAAELELTLKAQEAQISAIAERTEALIALCKQAVGTS